MSTGNHTDVEPVARAVLDAAFRIHTALGPGLLESAYEACLEHELAKRQLSVQKQVPMPLHFDDAYLPIAYRLDMLVAGAVVVEVKCVERLHDLHRAQLLSYLRLGGFKLGLLLNFNTLHMRNGIRRVANKA
jgi:GxxExxY protein